MTATQLRPAFPGRFRSAVVVQKVVVLALAGVDPVVGHPVPAELETDAGLGEVVDTAVRRALGDAVAFAADVPAAAGNQSPLWTDDHVAATRIGFTR
jgi:hypothetical protein